MVEGEDEFAGGARETGVECGTGWWGRDGEGGEVGEGGGPVVAHGGGGVALGGWFEEGEGNGSVGAIAGRVVDFISMTIKATCRFIYILWLTASSARMETMHSVCGWWKNVAIRSG